MNRGSLIGFAGLVIVPAVLATANAAHAYTQAQPDPSASSRCTAVDDTFSPARIVELANGERYAVFGTGRGMQGGDGRARLLLENLQDQADGVVIDTGVGHNNGGQCDDVASDCNALAEVELADIDGDGVTDWVYAGDLHGNLWAFALGSENGVPEVTATRLFTSCGQPLQLGDSCAASYRQPITQRVAVARNAHLPNTPATPNINVYWGTGQLRTVDDTTDTSTQAFYSVLHTGSDNGASMAAHFHPDLVERSYRHLSASLSEHGEARSVEGRIGVDYRGLGGAHQYGWYIPLPEPGERVLSRPLVVGDMVVFTSLVPAPGEPCDMALASWVNVLSLMDGLTPWRRVGDDYSAGAVLDYNRDGVLDETDQVDEQAVVAVRVDGEAGPLRLEGDRLEVDIAGPNGSSQPLGWRIQLDAIGSTGRVGWYQLR